MYEATSSHDARATASFLITLGAASLLAACSSDDSPAGPDVTAPAVSSTIQNRTTDPTGQTVTVNFNEPVTMATANVAGSYTFSGGVNVTTATLRPNGQTVDLVLDAPAIPGINTISIAAAIDDAAGNTSAIVTARPLATTDSTAPAASTIAGTTISGRENDQISVVFNDDMIESEVETIANWTIESPLGSPWDATGATVEYTAATRTAVVTLGALSADQNLQTFDDIHASFTTMRDLGGNTVTATSIGSSAVSGMVLGDTSPPILLAAAPGGGTDLTLTFDEDVTDVELADLMTGMNPTGTEIMITDVNGAGVASTGTIALTGTVADGDQVTISDGTTAVTFEFDFGATGTITLNGNPNDADSVTIEDGVNPAVTFEYDSGGGAVGTLVTIGVDEDATIANLITAINADGTLGVTASPGASLNACNLRNDLLGAAGNVTLLEVNTSGNQTLTGMADGGTALGTTAVAVDTASIANTVTNLMNAINLDAFAITASAGGTADDFVVTNDAAGVAGNVTITETDSGGVIGIVGMTGGIDAGTQMFAPTASTNTAAELQALSTFSVAPEAGDSLRIYGVRDLAGNQMVPETSATVVAADVVVPAVDGPSSDVAVVSGENNDVVTLVFAAPIHPDGAEDPANYTLNDGAVVDISDATFEFDQVDTVTITFDAATMYNVQSADTLALTADGLRNTQGVPMLAPSSVPTISPSGDSTAPTVVANTATLDPLNASAALITFDEAIDATSGVATANYAIAGNTTTAVTMLSPRVVRVAFQTDPTVSDSIDVEAAALTDLGGNQAVGMATIAITTADATAPTVDALAATTGLPSGRDQLVLDFSEPVTPAQVLDPTNYSVMSGGAISLTGATLTWLSGTSQLVIDLAEGIALDTGASIDVMISGIDDHSGNSIVTETETSTVAGDSTAPSAATAFVNKKADATGATVDVQFAEAMDATATTTIASWTGSGGQAATAATQLEGNLFRVTFDAPIGSSETIDIATPTDRAQNVGGTITTNPIE